MVLVTYVLVLKELRHTEEEVRTFMRAEDLPSGEQVYDLGEKDATFSGRDWTLVKDASLLEDCCPVDICKEVSFRVLILLRVGHREE